jgi:hypothetical protein
MGKEIILDSIHVTEKLGSFPVLAGRLFFLYLISLKWAIWEKRDETNRQATYTDERRGIFLLHTGLSKTLYERIIILKDNLWGNSKWKYIFTCYSDSGRGFVLDTGFIDHLYTRDSWLYFTDHCHTKTSVLWLLQSPLALSWQRILVQKL